MAYAHRIKPGTKVSLADFDPDADGGLDKEAGTRRADELGQEFGELEDLLFEAGTHSLLIVLQGIDTSGKDGTIRHLLGYANVQSCRVNSFKVPTPEELAHDFLWRVHAKAPGRGEIAIFNRSHYEDVLVVRVHELVPEPVWSKRYAHIDAWERLLVDSNTIILKFMLLIDKDEQERRLLDREKEVQKAWKLSVGDWKEREFWDRYLEAYEAALTHCTTEDAPWYVVPANKKWFRNLAVTEAVVERLRPYRSGWLERLEAVGAKAKAELEAYRAG
ncbi:MAG TPA: hypothetical protein PLH94_06430 [Fimbriimonadaceae bacterium]|nr:hypothetical protein [Fimbriimonadaceae bacterium]